MDRDLDSVRNADEQKEPKYSRLRQALERTLQPGWKVHIAMFSVGVRGTVSATFDVGRDDGLRSRRNPLGVTLYEDL